MRDLYHCSCGHLFRNSLKGRCPKCNISIYNSEVKLLFNIINKYEDQLL